VNYVKKGSSKIAEIKRHYRAILSDQEIASTIAKLINIECVKRTEDNVTITETGKCII
jgi:predicted transcriptional regulator